VRTKYHSPQTNGVIERFYEFVKYDYLYRLEVGTGHALGHELEAYRAHFNEVRPHEHLDYATPFDAYLRDPESNVSGLASVQET
jgi:putative transposase